MISRTPIEQMDDDALRQHAIDDLFSAYVGWREECRTLREAYDRCTSQVGRDAADAYWAYLAALEREEQAATVYALNMKSTLASFGISC